MQWLDFYDGLKINGSYALLMNSKATCAMGVPNGITFINSGQIACLTKKEESISPPQTTSSFSFVVDTESKKPPADISFVAD